MTQQPLFIPTKDGERPALPVPTLPLARKSDPDTSKKAASEVAGTKALGQAQLEAFCLVKAYPGQTANELSRLAGHGDPRKVNRRLRELERVGHIYTWGTSVDPVTNKSGLRWWPK